MAQWKKRSLEASGADIEELEGIISNMMDSFETADVDFTKQFKVAFTCSLDSDGCVHIDEFGFMGENLRKMKKEEPLVEIIEFEKEILAVVDATNLSTKDVDFRVTHDALLLSE